MICALPYKTKQFFFVLIKLSIVIITFYFIHYELTNNGNFNFSVFSRFLTKIDVFLTKIIIFFVFWTIFNWFFEILKCPILVSGCKKTLLKMSLEQYLESPTASLFTLNNIDEYGAKAVYFIYANKKSTVLLSVSSLQNDY